MSSGVYFGGVAPTVTEDSDDSGTDGLYTWYKWTDTASTGSYSISGTANHEYLLVGGGGGGSAGSHGGAGGGGGVLTATGLSLTGGNTYTATVGAGGAARSTSGYGNVGNDTILSGTGITTLTAGGGGAGGPANNSGGAGRANNGSGGGGGATSHGGTSGAGGSGIVILRRLTADGMSGGNDLTLQSTANTASATATKADLVMLMENGAGTASINVDIKGYVTADGGSNWTEGTLVDEGTWGTNKKIYAFHDATVTSGTDMRYKITTHNQVVSSKETKIHAVSLGWKA